MPAEIILENMKTELQAIGRRRQPQATRADTDKEAEAEASYAGARLSDTTYARINESGKNTRLRRK